MRFFVVWSGRSYLTVDEPPAPRVPPAPPRPQALISAAWLDRSPEDEPDAPRIRMRDAARTANAPFTVAELAQAAAVSKTLVRRFLARAERRGECRRVGRRPRARTFADVYVFEAPVVVDVPLVDPSVAWRARSEGA